VSRQKPSLRPPKVDGDLDRFPRFALKVDRTLWRVVRDDHHPWWFSSSMEGRFDLPPPDGTGYVASDDLGALLERLGPGLAPGGIAPSSLLAGRHLRALHVPRPHVLADSLARRATRWLTSEISTITPYHVPQAWARAFRGQGFMGIRYGIRHSTWRRHFSVAIFGPSGERNWRKGRQVPISESVHRRLRETHGIVLFDLPATDELVFAPDPPGGPGESTSTE